MNRAEWKEAHRAERLRWRGQPIGNPRIKTHFWYQGKRVTLKGMPMMEFHAKTLDCRYAGWNTLLMDVELIP